MTRLLLLFILPLSLHAQQSDILLLQKHNRTIRQFFAGTNITFITTDGMTVSGFIDRVEHDSLFLLQHDVKMVPNRFGTFSPDTIAVYKLNFSTRNIGAFPAKPPRFSFLTNGTLLMVGGSAYLLLNLVNTIREGFPPFGKDNLPNLIGGTAALATGFLLSKLKVTQYRVGKKYKLKYLPVVSPASRVQ